MTFFLRRGRRAAALISIIVLCLLTGCGTHIDPTLSLEEPALEWLLAQGNAQVGDVIDVMHSIEAEREASAEASREESRAQEESLREESRKEEESRREESIRQEAASKSIAESEYAASISSSIEESASIEESLFIDSIRDHFLSGSTGGTGVLTPGKVSILKESELPKLRSLFSDTIVVGNSLAYCIINSGLFTQNEVIYRWAARVDEIMAETIQAAKLYRGKVLFVLGTNDLGYYKGDVDGFKQNYTALINAFREINPDAQIFIQEIIPIHEAYRSKWYNMFRVPDYNEALREMCAETGCTLVTSSIYALEELLIDDGLGVHYNRDFHIYWAQAMANQMNLWEDMR